MKPFVAPATLAECLTTISQELKLGSVPPIVWVEGYSRMTDEQYSSNLVRITGPHGNQYSSAVIWFPSESEFKVEMDRRKRSDEFMNKALAWEKTPPSIKWHDQKTRIAEVSWKEHTFLSEPSGYNITVKINLTSDLVTHPNGGHSRSIRKVATASIHPSTALALLPQPDKRQLTNVQLTLIVRETTSMEYEVESPPLPISSIK